MDEKKEVVIPNNGNDDKKKGDGLKVEKGPVINGTAPVKDESKKPVFKSTQYSRCLIDIANAKKAEDIQNKIKRFMNLVSVVVEEGPAATRPALASIRGQVKEFNKLELLAFSTDKDFDQIIVAAYDDIDPKGTSANGVVKRLFAN